MRTGALLFAVIFNLVITSLLGARLKSPIACRIQATPQLR